MKRIATMIAVILAMLALTLSVGATESETLATAESTTPVTEAPVITEAPATEAPAITEAPATEAPVITEPPEPITEAPPVEDDEPEYIPPTPDTSAPAPNFPDEESFKDSIIELLDKLDEDLSGIEIWETLKAWILKNLNTVVGVLMILAALIHAFSQHRTKIKHVIPKITGVVTKFGKDIGTWSTENTTKLTELETKFDTFTTKNQTIIDKVAAQSEENLALRQRLVAVEEDYIKATEDSARVQNLLLGYTKLSAEQFHKLIQCSDMTKAELDDDHDYYKKKIACIEEAEERGDKE